MRSLWEPTILRDNSARNNATTASCERLMAVLPVIPRDGPVVSFMNSLAGEGYFNNATNFNGSVVGLNFQLLSCYPMVLGDDSERSLAMNLLLQFLRNALLYDSNLEGEDWFHCRIQNEVMICSMIDLLELSGTYSDFNLAKLRACKVARKLIGGNRRDVVKFVAKRLPCNCLKKLHRDTRKKVAKEGMCDWCGKQFLRSQLYMCTGCIITEYCSEDCQRADWSQHKGGCGRPEVMSRDLPVDCVLYFYN